MLTVYSICVHVCCVYCICVADLVLIVLIETSQALFHLPAILSSSPRLVAVIMGGDDYAADIGAIRTVKNTELLYVRQYVVSAAKAYHLQAIDIVNIHYEDDERLRAECREGAEWGYTGKQIIHPKQIQTVQSCFAPHGKLIAWAQRVVSENARFAAQGIGAFSLDGQMIDLPTVKNAENVLNRARACKLI